jgi:hypothetical protein
VIALPDTSPLPTGALAPEHGSREELQLARTWSDELADQMEAVWRGTLPSAA